MNESSDARVNQDSRNSNKIGVMSRSGSAAFTFLPNNENIVSPLSSLVMDLFGLETLLADKGYPQKETRSLNFHLK
jgi:hypothetical protein